MSPFTSRPIVAKHVDVLLGRGRGSYEHRGNVAFMKMIAAYLPAYIAATKNKGKVRITVEIMSLVKNSGGRFLASENRVLYEVSDAEARTKVSQALRHQRGLLVRDKKAKSSQVSGAPTPPRRITASSKNKQMTKSLKPICATFPRETVGVTSMQNSLIECGKDVGNDQIHKIVGSIVSSNCVSPIRPEPQKVAIKVSTTQLPAEPRAPICWSSLSQETQLTLNEEAPNCVSPVQPEQPIIAFELPPKQLLVQPQGNQLYADIDVDEVSEFSLVEILDNDFQCL